MVDKLRPSLYRALVAFCGTVGVVAVYVVALHAILSVTCGAKATQSAVEFVNFNHEPTNSINLALSGAICIASLIFVLSFAGWKRELPVGYLRTLILALPITLILNILVIFGGLRLLGNPDPQWDSDPKWIVAHGVALINACGGGIIPLLMFVATEFPRWKPPLENKSVKPVDS